MKQIRSWFKFNGIIGASFCILYVAEKKKEVSDGFGLREHVRKCSAYTDDDD